MWKPKFKYLSGLFAKLGVFILPNGSSYQGPYHQDELGRFMTGERPGPGAELLIEDPAEKTTEQRQEEEVFSSVLNYPTPKDYKTGFMNRYFLKNTITGKIIEANKRFYDEKIPELYIQGVIIKWVITKPVKDIFNQGYLYQGAASRNQQKVMQASLEMKGLNNYIQDFERYANIESDVEGYKFEELSEVEQIRIIKQQPSNLQSEPTKEKNPIKNPPKRNSSQKGNTTQIPISSRAFTGYEDEGFNEESEFNSSQSITDQNERLYQY